MVETPQILLVEKEQSVINQIVDLVEKIGFLTPKIAGTREEASKIAGSIRPDIALVGLSLEGQGDGQTTARMLREEFNMPVVFLTSREMEEERDGVLAPYGFVLKPVDRRSLKKTIMLALSRHSQLDNYSIYLSDLPIPAFLVASETIEVIKTNTAFSTLFPSLHNQESLDNHASSNDKIAEEFTRIIKQAKQSKKLVNSSAIINTTKGQKSFSIYARKIDSLDRSMILVTLMEAAVQKSGDMFNLAPAMMLQMDVDGNISRANKKWLDKTGYTAKSINGSSLSRLLGYDANNLMIQEALKTIASGDGEYEMQLDLRHQNGDVIAYQVQISSQPDDTTILAAFSENRIIPELNRYKEEAVLSNALRDSASALTSTLNFDEVLDRILVNVGEVVPNEAANVMMIWSGVAYIVRSTGYAERGIEEEMMSLQIPITQESHFLSMFTTGLPLAVGDIQEYAALDRHSEINWARSMASAPLRSKGQVFGFLNLESSQPDFYSQIHAERLQAFADQAAVAIENARLYAEVQQFAITDELTDIYNRRGLFELGRREVERARRYGRNLSAVMIDSDNFKSVNDNFSHAVGDQVLRSMAGRFKNSIREVDLLGRYGGDEFVVLLPETEIECAVQVADRLRMSICGASIETSMGDVATSVSVGVAALDDSITSFDELMEKADQAMFLAKTSGKNQVKK
jgi:diguanylate cyclase (GGDEF)-like protein/PAS domain S-box-containing protein